jgi:hypothetical protein
MVKHISLLLFIAILISCANRSRNSEYARLIKGDWFGGEQIRDSMYYHPIFITFDDSTYRIPSLNKVIKYKVVKGYLFIANQKGKLKKYTIVKLTTDSLIYLSGPKRRDTLKFSKIHPKNNITPSAIYFASSGCFGKCPIMQLQIDSNRNIRFYGDWNTSTIGYYKGKISENVYNSIVGRIRNLPVDSLKEYYEAPWTDDQTLGIAIAHGNTVTRSTAYGHYKEPKELHLLFTQLMNLHKELSLQSDSLVKQEGILSDPLLKSMTDLLDPPLNAIPESIAH